MSTLIIVSIVVFLYVLLFLLPALKVVGGNTFQYYFSEDLYKWMSCKHQTRIEKHIRRKFSYINLISPTRLFATFIVMHLFKNSDKIWLQIVDLCPKKHPHIDDEYFRHIVARCNLFKKDVAYIYFKYVFFEYNVFLSAFKVFFPVLVHNICRNLSRHDNANLTTALFYLLLKDEREFAEAMED